MNNNCFLKLFFLFVTYIIVGTPLNGQTVYNDSAHDVEKYRLNECERAVSAIKSSMPYTAIEIIQEIKKKYQLNNLEYGIMANAYNITHSYEKTKELYKESNISKEINRDNLLFYLLYIKALSETEEYHEALPLREKAINYLENNRNYMYANTLTDEYYYMSQDYYNLKEYDISQKWLDKAITLRLTLIDSNIKEVVKEKIVDNSLANFFATYYMIKLMQNPIGKDNDCYLALSVACGNANGKNLLQLSGKNYKSLLRRFLRQIKKKSN